MLNCTQGQGFGKNYNPSYHEGGLIGHTGIDINCGYGTPIDAKATGLVYSTFPVDCPANDGYTGVFTLCNTPLETFEFSYGHVSEINCSVGDVVQKDQVIAKEGNKGVVYSGNVLISLPMQAQGDQRGSHRHYQKRPVLKTKQVKGRVLSTAMGAYKDQNGFYYQVYNYENGFNGCVDWQAPLFQRNISVGSYGYDILLLQRACVLERTAKYEPTGYFGLLTLASVIQLQRSWGLPPTGFVGEMTRSKLNNKYFQLS